MSDPARSVDDIIDVLVGAGDAADDNVTAVEHALQCAAVLAAQHPGDEELHVAGLLHDIGHLLVPGDDAGHGDHAAGYLRPLLGDRIADLVALHVPAKRWLVTVDDDYRARLSDESTRTLRTQGDAMSLGERAAFEAHPCWDDAVTLRRADDDAKEPGRLAGAVDDWVPVLQRLAR